MARKAIPMIRPNPPQNGVNVRMDIHITRPDLLQNKVKTKITMVIKKAIPIKTPGLPQNKEIQWWQGRPSP